MFYITNSKRICENELQPILMNVSWKVPMTQHKKSEKKTLLPMDDCANHNFGFAKIPK
jgi:hypothetical protein